MRSNPTVVHVYHCKLYGSIHLLAIHVLYYCFLNFLLLQYIRHKTIQYASESPSLCSEKSTLNAENSLNKTENLWGKELKAFGLSLSSSSF